GIVTEQRAIGRQPTDPVILRDRARCAQLALGAPEMEMLQRALRQVLALRDRLRLQVPLDHRRANAALAKINRKPEADWSRADNQTILLVIVRHATTDHNASRRKIKMPRTAP